MEINRIRVTITVLTLVAIILTSLIAGCTRSHEPALISVGEEQYFALKIGDQIIGYNTYRVTEESQYQDQDVYVIEGHTLLQVNMPAGEMVMDYQTVTYLKRDLTPAYYRLDFSDGTQEQHGEVKFSEEEGDIPAGTLISDGNVFEHYVFLVRALDLKRGQTTHASIFMPQMMDVLESEFAVSNDLEEISSGGQRYEALAVEVNIQSLPQQTFWITEEGRLARVDLPSQNFTMEPSDASVVTQVSGIDMSALLADKFTDSNVNFSFMTNVTYMEALVEVKIAGEDADVDFLSNEQQRFQGTVEDNLISGTIENQVVRYNGENAPAFPVEVSDSLVPYLQPDFKIESDDPEIMQKAQEITEGSHDAREAAQSIADWVYRNIQYELTGSGAKQALIDRKGDCGPHALLTIAMCRAVGIPARLVGGFAYANGQFGQHYWVETNMGEAGWVSFDPTVGEYGWVDATHVRLFQNAAIEALTLVKVINYVDRAEGATGGRVKLELQVGQKGRYSFAEDGTDFGYAEYEVLASESQDVGGVYDVLSTLHLELSGACKPTEATSTLILDEAGIPISYESEASIGKG